MKKLLMLILFLPFCLQAQERNWNQDQKEILELIEQQRQDWNNFDLPAFMEGYWKSDSLKFYGKSGVTHGWDDTLKRYQEGYPSKDYTGELKFVIHEISPIEKESYYVLGEFYLTREAGNANGIFMIILKKIDGNWKIIADTSA